MLSKIARKILPDDKILFKNLHSQDQIAMICNISAMICNISAMYQPNNN